MHLHNQREVPRIGIHIVQKKILKRLILSRNITLVKPLIIHIQWSYGISSYYSLFILKSTTQCLTQLAIQCFIQCFTRCFTYCFTYRFTYWFTDRSTHWLTHTIILTATSNNKSVLVNILLLIPRAVTPLYWRTIADGQVIMQRKIIAQLPKLRLIRMINIVAQKQIYRLLSNCIYK
ncbi:conserved hypothetical protein [Lodderomyces elongisporus NRRL YB-4239]|uniref:Uncharacterized protein n=1 Tax=Lodderomyces elongisporus (strain ATCC 11503 / CBS 2605 / JCM 1781 / NBRC 1676 / NRRL YB-4239) TaxID=379508 RepID=A5E5R7_LODEL|nr:conserved hypothetical protein [Lodderomyces elongisporus NRRL YB-4239]